MDQCQVESLDYQITILYLRMILNRCLLVVLVILAACSPKSLPYENGPEMSQRNIKQTFGPIVDFMEYKPGMTVADVGAGSGALTVMMATLMDSSIVYVQDIDTTVLTKRNLDNIIKYYSKQTGHDLTQKNQFTISIGETQR